MIISTFLDACSEVDNLISDLRDATQRPVPSHSTAMDTYRHTIRRIRTHIDNLQAFDLPPENLQIKNMQMVKLEQKYRNCIDTIYQIDQRRLDKEKAIQLRQLQVINPHASLDDLDSVNPTQIFGDAIRYHNARHALVEVKQRHQLIQELERGVIELQQLFVDLGNLIATQGYQIDTIEDSVNKAVVDTERGNIELDGAIKYRKRQLKMYWCLCLIAVLVVIGLCIYIFVFSPLKVFDLGTVFSSDQPTTAVQEALPTTTSLMEQPTPTPITLEPTPTPPQPLPTLTQPDPLWAVTDLPVQSPPI